MKPTISSCKRVDGMFEFVFVCTAVYFLLNIREQEHMIDKRWADEERANADRILNSGCLGSCNEIVDWATRVYNSPGMMQT